MPAAAGAVAAAAVADQMLGTKEDRKLAIVLVFFTVKHQSFLSCQFDFIIQKAASEQYICCI